MFRFDYSHKFIQWAITSPNWKKALHLGVRAKKSRKLVGFITGIPCKMSTCGDIVKSVEINFLCVHKKLRSQRLAPLLIKEITRKINLLGIFQAV